MKSKTLLYTAVCSGLALTAGLGTIGFTHVETATSDTGRPTVTATEETVSLSPNSDDELHPYRPGGPDGNTFYSPSDTAKLWTKYIKSVTAPLPEEVRFPGKLKQFEDQNDGEERWIQDGLVPQLAGRYWQCACEDIAVTALKIGDKESYSSAAYTASTWLTALPGLEKFFDNWTTIGNQKRAGAAKRNLTVEEYDLSMDCGLYFHERPGKDQ